MKKILTSSVLFFIISCGSGNDSGSLNSNSAPPPSLNSFSFLTVNNPDLNNNLSFNLNTTLNGDIYDEELKII